MTGECGGPEIATVRDYFSTVFAAAQRCINEFEELEASAYEHFKSLSDQEQDERFSRSLKRMKEESPIRVLENRLSAEEYQRLLALLA